MKRVQNTVIERRLPDDPRYDEATATHLIRKMQGRSRSILAFCEDGFCYVIKFAGNPKGRNALANEILGYQFAGALGIRTPKIYFMTVDPFLIRHAPVD